MDSGRLRARSRDGDLQDNDFREARKRAVRDGPSRLLPDFVMDFQMIWKLAMQDSTRSTSNRWAAAPLPLSSWNPERRLPCVGSIFVYHGICLTYSYKVPLLYLCVSMFGIINIIIYSGSGGQGGFTFISPPFPCLTVVHGPRSARTFRFALRRSLLWRLLHCRGVPVLSRV